MVGTTVVLVDGTSRERNRLSRLSIVEAIEMG